MEKDKPELLTVDEVAKRLKVHNRTVYRRIKEGSLRAVKLGRLWRVPEDALEEYLEKHAHESPKGPREIQLKLF